MESRFYRNTYASEARPWVVRAIAISKKNRGKDTSARTALDIGCGVGMDSAELAKAGFQVYSLDPCREAFRFLKRRFRAERLPLPRQLVTSIQKGKVLKGRQFDLVNASYSIPFISQAKFKTTWRRILSMVRPGGLISGNIFGDRDSWAGDSNLVFHTRGEAKELLKGFQILHFKEWEHNAKPAVGELKHWHLFSFVARRL